MWEKKAGFCDMNARYVYIRVNDLMFLGIWLLLKRAEEAAEEEDQRGWRSWLSALLSAIPGRNRGSIIKYPDVCRVFPSSLEDEAQTEKDEGNKTQLEREYELAR